MPKGEYNRHTVKRAYRNDIRAVMEFYYRPDIQEQITNDSLPHHTVSKLYEQETGKHISPACIFRQLKRWKIVDGQLTRT